MGVEIRLISTGCGVGTLSRIPKRCLLKSCSGAVGGGVSSVRLTPAEQEGEDNYAYTCLAIRVTHNGDLCVEDKEKLEG
jgi:hypothetical protein